MATRLLSPDGKCDGATVEGSWGRRRRYAGTTITVSDPADVRALRREGYTVADAAGAPARTDGYKCADCGFKGYFKTCGRCGGTCDRPDIVA